MHHSESSAIESERPATESAEQSRPNAHRSRGDRSSALASSPIIRRFIGVLLALGMAYGVFHVVFRTDLLGPVIAQIGPIRDGIDWVLADPSRAWMALAVLVIPHIGAYYLFFEDHR